METDPLLPITITATLTPSTRRKLLSSTPPSLLCPLPEEGEISLPFSPPSSFKDRLIFGSHLDLDTQETLTLINSSSPPTSPNPNPNPFHSSSSFSPTSREEDDQSWLSDPFLYKTKTNLHRSRTAPAMSAISDHPPISEPRPSSSPIVRPAILLLSVYLTLGVVIYTLNRHHFSGTKTHPVVDALYFCIVTMCTIGYGDITPRTPSTKIFSIMLVLVGFGLIDILLSGVVSYILDLQEALLLSAVKGGKGKHDVARSYIVDVKKGRMRIRMKVCLALGVVVLCIGVGAGVMYFSERLGFLDSLYLSIMSVTTVGYGDQAFKSLPGRMFASVWLLVSTLAVARAFLYLVEFRLHKRQRMIAKWVLCRDMTVSEFLAADMDNNGFVSKSEYVIYKLKEMGKISEKDISQICNQFDRMDTGNCGKITLSDLIESHH